MAKAYGALKPDGLAESVKPLPPYSPGVVSKEKHVGVRVTVPMEYSDMVLGRPLTVKGEMEGSELVTMNVGSKVRPDATRLG